MIERQAWLRAVGAAFGLVLALWLGSSPAAAMCGGNLFMTCPPSAKAGADAERAAKREARLKAVQTKKRHYPLGRR